MSLVGIGCGLTLFMDLNVGGRFAENVVCWGYYNHKLKTLHCSMCKNGENMAKMRLPYACKLLFQVLLYCILFCWSCGAMFVIGH